MGRRRKIPDGAREIDGFIVHGNMTDEEFRTRIAKSVRRRAYASSLPSEVRARVHEFILLWFKRSWNGWSPTYAEYGTERLPEYAKFIQKLQDDGFKIKDLDAFDDYVGQQFTDAMGETGDFGDD